MLSTEIAPVPASSSFQSSMQGSVNLGLRIYYKMCLLNML